MKSVVQAMWLLVVAFGNLIDIIVASVNSGMSRVLYLTVYFVLMRTELKFTIIYLG